MVLKETDCNNYIVSIEKYLETIRFDGLVVETSNRRNLRYRIQWVHQKSLVITPTCIWDAQFLSLMGCLINSPMGG